MATKPFHATFCIPELAELILSHLAYHDLVSIRRTSKWLREVINNDSNLVLRVMFLEPCPATCVARWSGSADLDFSFENLVPLYRHDQSGEEALKLAGRPIVLDTSEVKPGDLIVVTLNPAFENAEWSVSRRCVVVNFYFDITDVDEFVAQDSRRAEMFVSQPPPRMLELKTTCPPWDGSEDTCPDVLYEDFKGRITIRGRHGEGVRPVDLQKHYHELEEKQVRRLDDRCFMKIEGFISERSRWLAVARGEMKAENVHRMRLGAGWL